MVEPHGQAHAFAMFIMFSIFSFRLELYSHAVACSARYGWFTCSPMFVQFQPETVCEHRYSVVVVVDDDWKELYCNGGGQLSSNRPDSRILYIKCTLLLLMFALSFQYFAANLASLRDLVSHDLLLPTTLPVCCFVWCFLYYILIINFLSVGSPVCILGRLGEVHSP